ncbi:hypothetical protein MMC25_003354 [Agyrium rufum]|nr:hypothetical protein [Agyrium rufum]
MANRGNPNTPQRFKSRSVSHAKSTRARTKKRLALTRAARVDPQKITDGKISVLSVFRSSQSRQLAVPLSKKKEKRLERRGMWEKKRKEEAEKALAKEEAEGTEKRLGKAQESMEIDDGDVEVEEMDGVEGLRGNGMGRKKGKARMRERMAMAAEKEAAPVMDMD